MFQWSVHRRPIGLLIKDTWNVYFFHIDTFTCLAWNKSAAGAALDSTNDYVSSLALCTRGLAKKACDRKSIKICFFHNYFNFSEMCGWMVMLAVQLAQSSKCGGRLLAATFLQFHFHIYNVIYFIAIRNSIFFFLLSIQCAAAAHREPAHCWRTTTKKLDRRMMMMMVWFVDQQNGCEQAEQVIKWNKH